MDVVISNGVIDLVPDKEAAFDEIDRILRPVGRRQLAAMVIHHEVSEDARSTFEDTRRKAAKYGAMDASLRATKP